MGMRYEGNGEKEKQIRSYVRKGMIFFFKLYAFILLILSCHPLMFSPKKDMFSESLYPVSFISLLHIILFLSSYALYVSFARMTVDNAYE